MNALFVVIMCFFFEVYAQELYEQGTFSRHPIVTYCTHMPCYRWDNYFYESNHSFDTFSVTPITEPPPADAVPIELLNIAILPLVHARLKNECIDFAAINKVDESISTRFANHGAITCCTTPLHSRPEVIEHFLKKHTIANPILQCPGNDCTYALVKDLRRLADHYIQKHFIPLLFACPSPGCFKCYKSRTALLVHIRECKFR